MTRLGLLAAVLLVAAPAMPVAPTAGAGPSGWTAQTSGTTERLTGVSFTDGAHGHVVGAAGMILVTNDGGTHWARQWACTSAKACSGASPDRVTADLAAVAFTDDAVGHAVGAGGTILATTNGGRSWVQQRPPAGVVADLTGVSFVNATEGYAVGPKGTILATFDGGGSWANQATCDSRSDTDCAKQQKLTYDVTAVSAIRPSEAYAVGHAGPTDRPVLLAGDGDVWENGFPPQPADLLAVDFVPSYGGAGGDSSAHGHAVGVGGVILFTTHGGSRWGPQESGTTVDLTGVAFHDEINGRIVGKAGTALVTVDGGQVWTSEPTGTSADLTGVSAPDASTAYAVGDGGTILKTGRSAPGLVVTRVNPPNGPLSGGTTVTVTGSGLTGATAVHFGRVRAKAVTVDSDAQLTAVSPEYLPGPVEVTVTTPDGTSAVVPGDRFSFRAPVLGTWEPAASCPSDCAGPSVLLHDGRLLALSNAPGDLTTVLLFDPARNTWQRAGPLTAPRSLPMVVVLPDGKVLIAGGQSLRTAEIFDPATGQSRPTARMLNYGGKATLLRTGEVLVAIDPPPGKTDHAQLFDPATEAWRLTGSQQLSPMTSITPLADGRVLAAGGYAATASSLYDPVTGTWRTTGPLNLTRQNARTVVLPGGHVLLVGGSDGAFPWTERYDPATETWRAAAPMNRIRLDEMTSTLLPDGKVLVVGGNPHDGQTTSTEVYDPAKDGWELATPMPVRGLGPHRAVLLTGPGCGARCGRVVILGGATHEVYLYKPDPGPAASRPSSGGPPVILLGGIGLLVGSSTGILLAGWYTARRDRRRIAPPGHQPSTVADAAASDPANVG